MGLTNQLIITGGATLQYQAITSNNHVGKLEYFTNLNSSAIKGDDSPYRQSSAWGFGRDVRS